MGARLLFVVFAVWLSTVSLAAQRPAVLFARGVHSRYVANPLHRVGFELDVGKPGQLRARLATGKFNVAVVGTLDEADRKAVADFLERGGGVLVCNPASWGKEGDWTATNNWLATIGAKPRWEVLEDADPANVVRDPLGCRLSWSARIEPPFNGGVRGVLTLIWQSTTGCEPPMSFDLSPDWKVVVRGAPSLRSRPSKRHDPVLQPWMTTSPGPPGPPLLAVRELAKGRAAVLAIRYYWLFTPPSNCPTAEAMLSAGAGGKPSDWLRVCANVFRWLAEPSMKAGMGGAQTPTAILKPPVKVWERRPPFDWRRVAHVEKTPDQPQTPGLVGARTALSGATGTVADYVEAAKAADLKFIVFLEDALKMNETKWKRLVAACDAASDGSFAAIPGLTYEDAQGNHLYAFADEVKFPKPSMLLPDGRLATTQTIRTRALFDYVNELMRQHIISGYWHHKDNELRVADYKLYNSFPIFSFVDGKPVDDAFADYQYLMSIGGCQAPLAFEIMTSPDLVATRAKEGWRVVAHRPPTDLRTKWHHGAWSFSGSGSQYVTNGPRILLWQGPNRLAFPRGEWWRPDLWEFRILLRAASESGLKSVTLYDGQRVFRRWLPGGAKTFQTELVLYNAQQLGLYPVVEDTAGRRAIGAEFWNRNLVMEEFFCSDRCNFLGNCRLRTRDGRQVWTQVSFKGNMGITPSKGRLDLSVQPAVCLTMDSPTLPIDGRPMGYPTVKLNFRFHPQEELPVLFAYPVTYLVGPEIAVGQASYLLAYDPTEAGAKATRLGHPYQQPQHGWGNSWGSWHRLVPTRVLGGWSRTYACNWIPGGFRIGWHETNVKLKAKVEVPQGGFTIMTASMPGWLVHKGGKVLAKAAEGPGQGEFARGVFATFEHPGGAVVVAPLEGPLVFRLDPRGRLSLRYDPGKKELAEGEEVRFQVGFAGAGSGTTTAQMVEFARKFGIAAPGNAGYSPKLKRGRQLDNFLVWRLAAADGAIEARVPKADLPGFLLARVEGLNDGWSVYLWERNRKGPNFRGLPVRDGRAYAELDLAEADLDLFIGHPVVCDEPRLRILVAWEQPRLWFIEAHNPTDRPLKAHLRSNNGWGLFALDEQVELAPGTSRTWRVSGKAATAPAVERPQP